MIEIGFLTAFLGGMLALLSPCSALLLPAFFASSVGARLGLLLHGAVFYLGLVLTLVPFGLGLGALGSFLLSERGLLIAITSIVLVVLGVVQMLGFGFDFARVLPGVSRVQESASQRSGLVRTLLLGAAGGVAGFCAGPILGAILTLAFAQSDMWTAGTMLAVYGAGMVVPLVILAALWQKMSARSRGILRGRTFTVFGRELHTTSVITGGLITGVGLLFWFTNGLLNVPSLIPSDVEKWLQQGSSVLANPIVDIIAIVAAMGVALAIWALVRRKKAMQDATPQTPAVQNRAE